MKTKNLEDLKNLAKTTLKTKESIITLEARKILEISLEYEKALSSYLNKPTLKFLKRQKGYTGIWKRAVSHAEIAGLNFENYIKAQFYYFNKWFKRAPKPIECASTTSQLNSLERAKMFKLAFGEKAAFNLNERSEATSPSSEVKGIYAAQQLQVFMRNYGMSEEEVFRTFAKGNDGFLYFDKEWLLNNQTYRKLKETGEI